jgi:predicted nucleic acid-binding protein
LLDTDAIIDYLRRRSPALALLGNLYARGDDLCVSDVVVAEVYSGVHENIRPRVERLIDSLQFLVTSPEVAVQAGEWRYEYRRGGRQLGVADCLIAATAHAHAATVVTGNVRDFPMPEVVVLELPKGP